MVEGEIAWPSYRCGLLWAVNRSRASMTHTFSLWQLSLGKEPADSIATCQKKRSGEQTGRSEGKRQIKGKKTLLSIAYEISPSGVKDSPGTPRAVLRGFWGSLNESSSKCFRCAVIFRVQEVLFDGDFEGDINVCPR